MEQNKGIWKVQRYSGRKSETWCIVFSGDEAAARQHHEELLRRVDRGGLRLLSPEGEVVASRWPWERPWS